MRSCDDAPREERSCNNHDSPCPSALLPVMIVFVYFSMVHSYAIPKLFFIKILKFHHIHVTISKVLPKNQIFFLRNFFLCLSIFLSINFYIIVTSIVPFLLLFFTRTFSLTLHFT